MGLFNRKSKKSAATAPAASAPAASTATAVADPASPGAELTGTWTLDPSHTTVGFSARHAMVTTVRGQFGEFEGTGVVDAANPSASSAKVVIKAASIDTGVADRDGHLRSGDFLDTEAFPELTFTSTEVQLVDGTTFRVTGDLTIKDATRPVTIDLEHTGVARDPFGNLRAGFEGETTINRKDWGLTWNAALETGGVLVSEKIKLVLDVSAIKSEQA
jgi:polyisoprenoid-binding protein YceI